MSEPCVSQDRDRIRTARLALDEVAELLNLIVTAEKLRAVCNDLKVVDLAPILARTTKKLEEARGAITRKATI